MARLLFMGVLSVIFSLAVVIAICKGNSNSLKLEQVLILSRHNVRTPLTSSQELYSPKEWTQFKEPIGELTQKGALLESYMADYFNEWLKSVDFIKGCPKPEEVLIYANTRSRTRATAKAFADAAFRYCNILIHHNENVDVFDPVFLPIYHNNSEEYIQEITKEIEKKLKETDLTETYLEINRILDLQHSEICQEKNLCDLSKLKNEVVYENGEELSIPGPLSIGTAAVDLFLMSYFEGFPLEDVAFGEVTTEEQWKLLCEVLKQNMIVRFTVGSKDIAGPLLKYMFGILRNGNPKFTMLVGHDSNLCPVIDALEFKNFKLKDTYEPYPIGGKLVFQKWSDGAEMYLKVEYIYPTTSQLRNGVKLSLQEPPNRVLLELTNCKMDARGLCPWDDFVNFDV